jgi:hypothetical protein
VLSLTTRRPFASAVHSGFLALPLTLGMFAATPVPVSAQVVGSSQDRKADELASEWAPRIVRTFYDYGTEIEAEVIDYKYYPSDNAWSIRVQITFGGLFDDKVYAAKGRLTIAPQKATWEQIGVNSNLATYLLGKKLGEELGKSLNKGNP